MSEVVFRKYQNCGFAIKCDLGMFYDEEEAVEAWNRRVNDD